MAGWAPDPTVLFHHTLGRYRLVEKIGTGGMGVVYRAHDENLDREVAIKVLSPGTLTDEDARKRFRKEARSLSKLNHPNIATVHDFDSQGGIDYLVMEYVPGKTLRDRISEGPLPEAEVIDLAVQLADGLSAAHGHSLVHRDLKPENIRLTLDGRPKILDFGLAKLVRPFTDCPTESKISVVAGTLPYMSPEQVLGGAVDQRTDLFSLGVVLYEMTTGQRPLADVEPSNWIAALLHTPPVPPREVNPSTSAGLETVILKALEKDSARRYQTAGELLADLERLTSGATPSAARRPRPSRALLLGSALLLIMLAVLITWYVLIKYRGSPSASTVPATARRSVAVLGFKNLSGRSDTAWISTALSEILTTELAAGEQLRIVPGESVAQMKISLALPDAESFSKDTLAKIRQNLGTDAVVLGSYVPVGNGLIRLDIRLQDAVAGETLAYVSEKGAELQLDELASKAGAELRTRMGVSGLSESQSAAVKASLPSNLEAARLYAEGLAKLRVFDSLGARDLLQKAVVLEPNFSLSHDALATAWKGLGYDAKATEEARKAFALSSGLSREERLSVEARCREATDEWDKAVEIYRTLFNFFPDNLDYGLRLARTQTSAGKANDALRTVETLRRLPSPARDDPRIGLAEVDAADSLGDFRRELSAATNVAERATAQGARLLLAEALYNQAWALQNLGDLQEATAAALQSTQIYDSMGDRFGASKALSVTGTILLTKGDLVAATQAYQSSLAIVRAIGNKSREAVCLHQLAVISYQQGRLAAAKRLYEQALAIFSELGNKDYTARARNNMAIVLHDEGDLAGAIKMYQETLTMSRQIGDKDNVGAALINLANTYIEQGHLDAAEKAYHDSLELFRETGRKSDTAAAHFGLGELFKTRGELVKAQHHHAEALSTRKEMGERAAAAESGVALAELFVEDGHAENAQAPVREAVQVFREAKLSDAELRAHLVLARSLLSVDRLTDAKEEIDFAAGLLNKTQKRTSRLLFDIVAARVRTTSGSPADFGQAEKTLQDAIARATKLGFVSYQLEARLALGEIELKSGKSSAGRVHLAALQKDATARGFLLIARNAATAGKTRF